MAGILDCQMVLHRRFTISKSSSLVRMIDLKARISKFWKTNAPWSMVSPGKGYFEFIFSSLDDLRAARSIWSWNLAPGLLRTFVWTTDFNPHTVQQANALTWIHIHGLLCEYWRSNFVWNCRGVRHFLDSWWGH